MSEKKTIRAGAVCLLVSLLAALFFYRLRFKGGECGG